MTGEELLVHTVKGLMDGDNSDVAEYREKFIIVLNILLQENLKINNALRAAKGEEPLLEAQTFTAGTMGEDLIYEPIFTGTILPYGLAGWLYMDDEPSQAAEYRNKYESMRMSVLSAKWVDITDEEDS